MSEKIRYAGVYNRLFPVKVSTNTFITLYTLHLLRKEKMYGKEIIDKIEQRFSGNWKPSHGLVYPILRELETENLIKGTWLGEGAKKTICVYEITQKGQAAYKREKKRHEAVFTQSLLMMETLMEDLYDVEMYDFTQPV